MKRRLRLRQILELLLHQPELGVEEVCTQLQASPATVRRDFLQLAKEGRVEKTWGGIRALGSVQPAPPAFATRLDQEAAEKTARLSSFSTLSLAASSFSRMELSSAAVVACPLTTS